MNSLSMTEAALSAYYKFLCFFKEKWSRFRGFYQGSLLNLALVGLLLSGVFLSYLTLQMSYGPEDNVPIGSTPGQLNPEGVGGPKNKDQRRGDSSPPGHVHPKLSIEDKKISTPPLPDDNKFKHPDLPKPPSCSKPSPIQLNENPTFQERFKAGTRQWERHPEVTGISTGIVLASPLLLTGAPVIAPAALVVATWLFVRGALGAC